MNFRRHIFGQVVWSGAEKNAMPLLPVSDPERDLGGSRIGLLGFPSQEARDLGRALARAKCLTSNLPATCDDPDDPLEDYDIVIVWAGEDGSSSRVTELVETSQRWLLLGPEERIRQNSSLYLRADDVVLTPYSLNELLFRIHRTIHRTNHRSQSVPQRPTPSVLVVDDDPAVLALLKAVLRNRDWECHFAADGRQALAMARELLPDLMVLDVEMPLMTGLEVLRRIRRDTDPQSVQVLLLTASDEFKHVEQGLSFGADDYLAKPFSHLALVQRVRKLLFSSNPGA